MLRTDTFRCAVFLLGALSFTLGAKTPQDSKANAEAHGRQVLTAMQRLADHAADDADRLASVRNEYNFPVEPMHDYLNNLHDEINKMGEDATTLAVERDRLAPWERQAIDEFTPLLREAALNTTQEIEHFRKEEAHMWVPDSELRLNNLRNETKQMVTLLHNYLKYEHLRDAEAKTASKLPQPLAN